RTRVTAGSVRGGGPYPMRTAGEALVVVSVAPEGVGTRPSWAWAAVRTRPPDTPEPGPTGPPVTWTRCRVHQGALVGRPPWLDAPSLTPRARTAAVASASEEPP